MRSAFTLLELLIVVAIIGVMVGLLLPAVQSVRETARSTSCQNNLLGIHLAVESYHHSFGVYPAGTVTDRLPARMFPDGKDHAWLVQVRPFMSGGFEFAQAWSPVHAAYHPQNWKLIRMGPATFSCPSNPFKHRGGVVPLSYAGIHDGANAPIDASSGGFFVANRFFQRSDIIDGLSHTLQLGEIRDDVASTFFWISGNQSTLRTTGLPMRFESLGPWGIRGTAPRTSIAYGRFGDPVAITYDMLMDPLEGRQVDPIEVAEALLMIDPKISADQRSASWTGTHQGPEYTAPVVGRLSRQPMPLGSTHQARIHGVFADGHVVTLNESIDSKLYRQMGIRNDSQWP